tara:strand:- start:11913 stop:15314 length:3402 start_codon:yes stop_codon:yes gene_type:complete
MDLNKISVKQQGGQMIPQQPGMQQQPMHQMPDGSMMPGEAHNQSGQQPSMQQPQVDPQIMQITTMISEGVNNGEDIIDVIIQLSEQQIDQQIIGEALIMGGMQQDDIVSLFEAVTEKMQPQPASASEVNQNPQELARNEVISEESDPLDLNVEMLDEAKSGIEIKKKNRGKFTAWAKRRGMGVQEAAMKVMANPEDYTPSVVKMANFAKNAAGWNKEEGGETAYLANRDRVIKREMAKAESENMQEGGEQTPEMKAYLEALEFNKIARQAIGTNNKEKLASFTSRMNPNRPYSNNELARDFSELQQLRQAAGLGLKEEASILFPHVGQQIRGGFNEILGTNFKEGGEFEPHFMYKGERKIRAKDMATHLRLKEAGYTHDAPKAETGGSTDNKLNKFEQQRLNNYKQGVVSNKPFYVNPLTFEEGEGEFNLGEAVNFIGDGLNMFSGKDLNQDGVKDGVFRDWEEKGNRNEAKKYANADYSIDNLDLSEKNQNAIKNYLDLSKQSGLNATQPIIDNNINSTIDKVSNTLKPFKNWVSDQGDNINEVGDATVSAISKLLQSKELGGGVLPKAQFNLPDNMFGNLNNFTSTPYDTQQDYFANLASGQTDFIQDTQNVADAQLQNQFPDLGSTPLEQSNQSMNNSLNVQNQKGVQNKAQGEVQDAYDQINRPTLNVDTGGIQGAANRALDSNLAKGYGAMSNWLVDGAGIATDLIGPDEKFLGQVNKREYARADNAYATYTQPFNYLGVTDINSGTQGSEADKTTGLYMGNRSAQEGGEPIRTMQNAGSIFPSDVSDYASANRYYKSTRDKYKTEEERVQAVRDKVLSSAARIDELDSNITDDEYEMYMQYINSDSDETAKIAYNNLSQNVKDSLPKKNASSSSVYEAYGVDRGRELYCTPMGCYAYQEAGANDMPTLGGNYSLTEKAYGSPYKTAGQIPFELISDAEREPGDMVSMYNYAPSSYADNGKDVWRPHHTGIYSGDGEPNVRTQDVYNKKTGQFQEGPQVEVPSFNAYNAQGGSRLGFDNSNFDWGGYYKEGEGTPRGNYNTEDPQFLRYVGGLPKMESDMSEARQMLSQYDMPMSVLEPAGIQMMQPEITAPQINTVPIRQQKGGEIMNINSGMIAKLIAAGADIEIL